MERAVCAGMAQWLLQQRDPIAAQWLGTNQPPYHISSKKIRALCRPAFAKRWVGPHGFMAPPPQTCLLRQVAWPLGGAISRTVQKMETSLPKVHGAPLLVERKSFSELIHFGENVLSGAWNRISCGRGSRGLRGHPRRSMLCAWEPLVQMVSDPSTRSSWIGALVRIAANAASRDATFC